MMCKSSYIGFTKILHSDISGYHQQREAAKVTCTSEGGYPAPNLIVVTCDTCSDERNSAGRDRLTTENLTTTLEADISFVYWTHHLKT